MCPPAHWPSECRPGWCATSRNETRPRRSGGWADPDPGLRRPALGGAGGPDEQSHSDAAVDGGAWSAGGVTRPPVGIRGDEPADLVWIVQYLARLSAVVLALAGWMLWAEASAS